MIVLPRFAGINRRATRSNDRPGADTIGLGSARHDEHWVRNRSIARHRLPLAGTGNHDGRSVDVETRSPRRAGASINRTGTAGSSRRSRTRERTGSFRPATARAPISEIQHARGVVSRTILRRGGRGQAGRRSTAEASRVAVFFPNFIGIVTLPVGFHTMFPRRPSFGFEPAAGA